MLIGLLWMLFVHLGYFDTMGCFSFSASSATQGTYSLSILFTLADGYNFWVSGIHGPSYDSEKPLLIHELYGLYCLVEDIRILGGNCNIICWPPQNDGFAEETVKQ